MGEPVVGLVLADYHPMFTEGLGIILNAEDDLAVLGVAHTTNRAIELVAAHRPSVLLLDAYLPGGDPAPTVAAAKAASPTKVLMLSADVVSRRSRRPWRPAPMGCWPNTNPAGG